MVLFRESFALGSKEAFKAKQKEKEILSLARAKHYKVFCNGIVIFDPTIEQKKAEYNRLKTDIVGLEKWAEKEKRLAEIKAKDLLELTEEEIVLLAQSRVHGDNFTYMGRPALGTPTTFEGEYAKIKNAIEQKKSGNRSMH